jgi:hypothetical protein
VESGEGRVDGLGAMDHGTLIKRVKRCSRLTSARLRCQIWKDHLGTVQYLGAELVFLAQIRCSAGRKRAERRMMGGEELFSLHWRPICKDLISRLSASAHSG